MHPVSTIQQLIDAFKTEDAHVLYNGHSNYGIGQLFANSSEEWDTHVLEDVRYVDDDRILNTSSPIVHVNVSYMRTGQAYPHWWPIYKDGTSAIVPYEKGDPNGDPAYNYYPTYQILGDPTHYKIETVRHSAVVRFPDWGGPAWYDPNGNSPDPTNPDHDQYYITNPEPWSPSFVKVGDWVDTNSIDGYYKENYDYSAAGTGTDQATWLFSIPEEGDYYVYAWYPASSSRPTNAPYTVNHALGSTTVPVNQRLNGGQWNSLGVFHFDVGDFSVVLTDNVSSGNVVADGIRIENVDNPPEILKANFFARNRSGPAPLTVTFSSQVVGDVDTFRWDFGDGGDNSSRDYLDHTYAEPGTYTVTYTVNGSLGSDTITKVGYINVGDSEEPLQAEFQSRSSQTGTAPHTVRFRDRSSGDIVSWEWDFDGDGIIDSTEQSPTYTYTTPGIYTLSLTVKDSSANTDKVTKSDFIRIILFDKNIDNVDYPKTHYRSKTLLRRKDLEVAKEDMKYTRFFYGGCDSVTYYTDTFQQGIFFYSTSGAAAGEVAMAEYLKAYIEGKSDYEIWEIIQSIEPLYDYYDFNKPPSEQW
jgi:PKD repeat protein